MIRVLGSSSRVASLLPVRPRARVRKPRPAGRGPVAQRTSSGRTRRAGRRRRVGTRRSRGAGGGRRRAGAVRRRSAGVHPTAQVRWRYRLVLNGRPSSCRRRPAPAEGPPGRQGRSTRARRTRAPRPSMTAAGSSTTAAWQAGLPNQGEGMKIAIIDDGVDQAHPYFYPTAYTMPPGFPKGQTGVHDREGDRRAGVCAAGHDLAERRQAVRSPAFGPRDPRCRHRCRQRGTRWRPVGRGLGCRLTRVHRQLQGAHRADRRGRRPRRQRRRDRGRNRGRRRRRHERDQPLDRRARGRAVTRPRRARARRRRRRRRRPGRRRRQRLRRVRGRLARLSRQRPRRRSPSLPCRAARRRHGELAGFSAAGPTPISLRLKPDISAPGVSVLSSVPGGVGTHVRHVDGDTSGRRRRRACCSSAIRRGRWPRSNLPSSDR